MQEPDIEYEPFPRVLVEAVDALLKKYKNCSRTVDTEKEWGALTELYRWWKQLFPEEYKEFIKGQKELRNAAHNKHASHREKGGAEMRHTLEFPGRFYTLMTEFFPDQKLTKEFSHKLAKRIPDLQVPKQL